MRRRGRARRGGTRDHMAADAFRMRDRIRRRQVICRLPERRDMGRRLRPVPIRLHPVRIRRHPVQRLRRVGRRIRKRTARIAD